MKDQLITEAQRHAVKGAVDYINESRREHEKQTEAHETADYTNESPRDRVRHADVIHSVVDGFLCGHKGAEPS